jgi:hypothetical protein
MSNEGVMKAATAQLKPMNAFYDPTFHVRNKWQIFKLGLFEFLFYGIISFSLSLCLSLDQEQNDVWKMGEKGWQAAFHHR